jgi:hypothetical protein
LEVEWKEAQPDILGSLMQGIDNDERMEVQGLESMKVALDDPSDKPVEEARAVVAALSYNFRWEFFESFILKETSIAGVRAYERIGIYAVKLRLEEQWSGLSPEEVVQ